MNQDQALVQRAEVPVEYRWQLEDLYPTTEAWEEDLKTVEALADEFVSYQGKIGDSAATFRQVLELRDRMSRLMDKTFVYAKMKRDEDNSESASQALVERAQALMVRVGTMASFFLPELMAIPQSQWEEFLQVDPELNQYRHFLEDLVRRKQHILSPEEERILALSGEIADSGENIFSMLNNADLEFPMVHDEEGREVALSHGRYLRFLESKKRAVRQEAFLSLHRTYQRYRNTLAAALNSGVKSNIFYARARRYPSALTAALDDDHIKEDVYHNLIDGIHQGLPLVQQYFRAKQDLLQLEEIHPYDLYVSPVADFELKVTYEEAQKMVKAGLGLLGEEYGALLDQAFAERWIDVYENKGKTSGAYAWGCYDSHPYILLNFQGTGNDLFTLAHELGHALHSYLSNRAQPYINAQYPIFLAEIASTVNEVLLVRYLIDQAQSKEELLYYLHHFLEHFRGTVFRQTMFAEFERLIHAQVEKGEALTPDWLEEEYYHLAQVYHGPGVVLDPELKAEWSRIPHFFYNFYVYKYATGFCAAVAFVQKFIREGSAAVEAYLELLRSGGTDYPLVLLAKAGVDLAQPQPITDAMTMFQELLTGFTL
ncbi:MAG TPA: oligoendopeptidase F [Firmicutes bacterium]|jgi:oligoendopeptidase F|nr:oligoendopeptidase F [Bacillota bacterium]